LHSNKNRRSLRQDTMDSTTTATELTDVDIKTDIITTITDNNSTVAVKQPTTPSSSSAGSRQVAAAAAQAESNGHGHHRRRKAQFEVGDDTIQAEAEEDDNQVKDNSHHRRHQGPTNDPEATGEETEGDDEVEHVAQHHRQQQQQHQQQHQRQASRGSQGHDSEHHAAASTSSSTAASAAVPVVLASNADSRDENGARVSGRHGLTAAASSKEDESLAKTLIDSTLARTIQDLSLQTAGQAPASTIMEEARQEQEEQQPQQQQEQARVRERSRSNQSQGEQHSSRQSARSAQHQEQQPQQEVAASEGQGRDHQPIDQSNHTAMSERRGHSLEKSKSNPPEVLSNSNGEGPHSHTTHKSSASIHESQNLSESPKPRHRALSRTSPKSKRMSMLLDPSSSTTLPSLTKVTTHTVMAIPPKQGAVAGDTSPSTTSSESSRALGGQSGSGKMSASSPTLQPSPAVELVSKFLTGATAATSTPHATNEDDHHNPQTGSPGQIRRSPKSLHDKSNATSPQQRTGYTSKFYPVSPSHPQLSSSAPKSTTTSKNLIPPTIVTTSTSDENLPDMSSATPASASATGQATGPFSTGLSSAATASAIAAAAVAQSNMAGGGSKTGTLSRTQQKLWLQRENLQDVDEDEMSRRGRMQKEMDRIQREYKCVRTTLDPSMESLLRCLARSGKSPLQLQQQAAAAAAAANKASVSQPQSPHPSSQGRSPVLDQQQHRPLQHHRSLQQLNGQQGQQQRIQQLQQQGHVGLGLQNGPGGAGAAGGDSGKMTLRQIHQLQQLHHQQQQQQQQQQGHHSQQQQQQQQQNHRQQHHG
ncbi:hypothetical protein BGZ96_002319, partial [Linnemannia gamsii]